MLVLLCSDITAAPNDALHFTLQPVGLDGLRFVASVLAEGLGSGL